MQWKEKYWYIKSYFLYRMRQKNYQSLGRYFAFRGSNGNESYAIGGYDEKCVYFGLVGLEID